MSKNAIAEGIINNVRKTIIRDQLTDPRFYERMSKLLEDLIKQSRTDAAAYEAFLRKAEDLVRQLASKGAGQGVPPLLRGKPEAIVIYNNLADFFPDAEVADQVHEANAGYSDERVVLNFLFPLLNKNKDATLALFEIIKNQPGY